MSIVVWVPLTGLPSGLPALTGVASGTPLPANAIAVPEGYDPADPGGLWDLFPTDQDATYAQTYTPIVLVPPFNITEAIEGVTLSGGTVRMLNYSLAPVATPIEGVTLSGGTFTPPMLVETPVASVVIAPSTPAIVAPDPVEIINPVTWSLVQINNSGAVASGNLFLGIPSSAEAGDLLVAHISYRDNAPFAAPSGWTIHEQQSGGNTVEGTASDAIASVLIATTIYNGSDTTAGFTRSGGNVGFGRITAWRASAGMIRLVDSSSNTLTTASATPVTGSLTTEGPDALILVAYGGASGATCRLFTAATDPTGDSGVSVNGTTGAITAGAWAHIYDVNTATGADTHISMGRAVKATAGATGQLSALTINEQRHAMAAVAFRAVTLGNPEIPASSTHVAALIPEIIGDPIVNTPVVHIVVGALAPEIIATLQPIFATYSQVSVWVDNTAATLAGMQDGIGASETSQTGTNEHTSGDLAWIQMDFGSQTSFSSVVVGAYGSALAGGWGTNNFYIDNSSIIGSNNLSTWDVLANTGQMPASGERIATFSTPGANYRYVRIRRSGYLAITEFYALP